MKAYSTKKITMPEAQNSRYKSKDGHHYKYKALDTIVIARNYFYNLNNEAKNNFGSTSKDAVYKQLLSKIFPNNQFNTSEANNLCGKIFAFYDNFDDIKYNPPYMNIYTCKEPIQNQKSDTFYESNKPFHNTLDYLSKIDYLKIIYDSDLDSRKKGFVKTFSEGFDTTYWKTHSNALQHTINSMKNITDNLYAISNKKFTSTAMKNFAVEVLLNKIADYACDDKLHSLFVPTRDCLYLGIYPSYYNYGESWAGTSEFNRVEYTEPNY